MGTGALKRELLRLEALGLLRRVEEDGKVYFDPVLAHPSWAAFRTLLREHGDPVDVVREVLRDVPGIKAAFVFGSTVRGGARKGSDVDVLIVEEGMPTAAIGRAMIEAESLLNRPLDVKRFTPAALAAKLSRGSVFLHEAVSGPKAWLIGSEDALAA
jgi:predicted nucleotidyltransferase